MKKDRQKDRDRDRERHCDRGRDRDRDNRETETKESRYINREREKVRQVQGLNEGLKQRCQKELRKISLQIIF